MRYIVILCLLAASASFSQYNSQNLTPAIDAGTHKKFTCEKLRIYPIIANEVFVQANKLVERTVPMNKALADGRLKVKEHADGAEVNTLQVQNTSKDTIYLMQGEVMVGGQQDRMLAQDLLVPPGATMDIGAFCVEQGRWSENGGGQQFGGTAGVVSQNVRKAAAISREQQDVWEQVAVNVRKTKAEAPTGSYVSMVNDPAYQVERKAYRDRLLQLPAAHPGTVGVIAVSGDRVIGCDVFANASLLQQAYPQLIEAYIAEALNNGASVTMTDAQLQAYFTQLFSDEEKLQEKTRDNGYLFKNGERTFRISVF
jgi:hypothetical protein